MLVLEPPTLGVGSEVERTGTLGRIGPEIGVMPGTVVLPGTDSDPETVGFFIFISGIVAGGGRVVFMLIFGIVVANGASEGLSATGAFGAMRKISTAGRPLSYDDDDDDDDDVEETISDIFVTLTVDGGSSRFGTGFFAAGISFVYVALIGER